MEWNYADKCVDVSVKGYVEKALQRFAHNPPVQPQHSPSGWVRPNCGAKVQMAPIEDDSELFSKALITHLQEIVGTLLCHGRAVDNTMLVAHAIIFGAGVRPKSIRSIGGC